MNDILLSVDPGKKSGWNVHSISEEKLLDYGLINMSMDRHCLSKIECIFNTYNPTYLAIEDQYLTLKNGLTNFHAVKSLVESRTMWMVSACRYGCIIHNVYASEWINSVLCLPTRVKRNEIKRGSIEVVKRLYNIHTNHNIADSINISRYIIGIIKLQMRIKKSPCQRIPAGA